MFKENIEQTNWIKLGIIDGCLIPRDRWEALSHITRTTFQRSLRTPLLQFFFYKKTNIIMVQPQ